MAKDRGRASRYDDEEFLGDNPIRINRSLSFKAPKVERTFKNWKVANKRKTFKQRCTRSETGGFCATNIGIITFSILFCYCIPPNLFPDKDERDHPQNLYHNVWRLVVFRIASVLASMNLLFLWLTYLTDPGVIPRQNEPELRILSTGERNCVSCKIIRPPRGKHCKYCDHCVEVFDHHCPYAGVCVGNGNYLFFCLLLLSGLLSSIYISVFSAWFVKDYWPLTDENWEALHVQLIVGFALTILSSSICLLVGHLCGYHVFIAVKGQTTNEWILKKRKTNRVKVTTIDTPSKEPLLGPTLFHDTTGGVTRYSMEKLDTKESPTSYNDLSSAVVSRCTDL